MSVNINVKLIKVWKISVSVYPWKNYSYLLYTLDFIRDIKIHLSVLSSQIIQLCCKIGLYIFILEIKSICVIIPVKKLYFVNNGSDFLALYIPIKFNFSGIKSLKLLKAFYRRISNAVQSYIHNRLSCCGLWVIFQCKPIPGIAHFTLVRNGQIRISYGHIAIVIRCSFDLGRMLLTVSVYIMYTAVYHRDNFRYIKHSRTRYRLILIWLIVAVKAVICSKYCLCLYIRFCSGSSVYLNKTVIVWFLIFKRNVRFYCVEIKLNTKQIA